MFYTIYKVTNLTNNKIYIGKHQTKNLDDGYMGSGKRLGQAKTKYGIENFVKEILFIFDNEQEMNDKEKELVTEEFCLREDTYNLCPGGKGGWGYINNSEIGKFHGKLHTKESKQKIGIASKGNKSAKGLKRTEEYKIKMSNSKKGCIGRIISDEERNKIGNTLKEYYLKNPKVYTEIQCPHCDKIGKGPTMYKHHFDKCKNAGVV